MQPLVPPPPPSASLMLGPQHLGDTCLPPSCSTSCASEGREFSSRALSLAVGENLNGADSVKPMESSFEVLMIPSEWLNSGSVVEGSSLYHNL